MVKIRDSMRRMCYAFSRNKLLFSYLVRRNFFYVMYMMRRKDVCHGRERISYAVHYDSDH